MTSGRPEVGALACLRCQLLKNPNVLCSRRGVCEHEARFHPFGAVLLGAFGVAAAFFVVSILR
jgi:hypothetical protein